MPVICNQQLTNLSSGFADVVDSSNEIDFLRLYVYLESANGAVDSAAVSPDLKWRLATP